jgi:hypothetical protein
MTKIEIHPDVKAAMTTAADLLADAQRLDEAIAKKQTEAHLSAAKQEEAAAALATLEADLAMSIDESAAKALEAKIKKAAAAESEARQLHERQQRIVAALMQRLEVVEADIAGERAVMDSTLNHHSNLIAEDLADELLEAAKPLIAALHRLAALNGAINHQGLRELLHTARLKHPTRSYHLFDMGRVLSESGDRTLPWSEGWQLDADLLEAHRVAYEPRKVLNQLGNYVPRAVRQKAAQPYVRRGYSLDPDEVPTPSRRPQQTAQASTTPAPPAPTPRRMPAGPMQEASVTSGLNRDLVDHQIPRSEFSSL